MSEKLSDERIKDLHEMFDYEPIRSIIDELKERRASEVVRSGERVFPKIVCLCGSTRFKEEFQQANLEETLKGNIVLSIGCNTKSDVGLGITEEKKKELDELHKRKIDLADKVLVLNVGGYIGSSTKSEIEYATKHGKPVMYLEPASH